MSSTPSPPPTLGTLPQELIQHICQLIDPPSALALALTSRVFTEAAQPALWRSLNIVIPQTAIESARQLADDRPPARTSGKTSPAAQAVKLGEEELRRKLRVTVFRADEKRMALVEEVKLSPRPGSFNGMIHLLDEVQPTIRMLELAASEQYDSDNPWYLPEHDTIDVRLLHAGLSFSALTHIRLGRGSIRFRGTILLLCEAAPELISLSVDIGHQGLGLPDDGWVSTFPTGLTSPTKLEELRFVFRDTEWEDEELLQPLVPLIKASPNLYRLSVAYSGWLNEGDAAELLSAMEGPSALRDLHWEIEAAALCGYLDPYDGPRLPTLRRLVLPAEDWLDIFHRMPNALPRLEILYLHQPSCISLNLAPSTPFPKPPSAQAMPSYLAFQISRLPRLRHIHTLMSDFEPGGFNIFSQLDAIEATGEYTGHVRSFVDYNNEGSELIHLRPLVEYDQISDIVVEHDFDTFSPTLLQYHADDNVCREKRFKKLPHAEWHDFTDYQDYVVPLEVIDRMRQIQGASEAEWQGRSVAVRDEAWSVLQAWYGTVRGRVTSEYNNSVARQQGRMS